MGAYHGAQACEIVGLFVLSKLSKLPNIKALLYRDDGLAITRSSGRQQEKLRQAIIQIFADLDLKITIQINLISVNFLDVTMDLEAGIFKPYRKPGDKPMYVHSGSNHPPQVLRNIALGINKRLVEISSTEEIFYQAIPPYQAELDRCGYGHKLAYVLPQTGKRKRRQKTRITWFNPPYSMNVQTNVGKQFLELIDKHFPPGHPLHSTINRQTVKISYRCLPNMGAIIAKHNSKVFRKAEGKSAPPQPSCNCQNKEECPVPGACNQSGIIYQTTVKSEGRKEEYYVGEAKNFKTRFYAHRKTLNDEFAENSTTLSTYYWKEKNAGRNPTVSWKFLENNLPTFNPVSARCMLCIREKYNILLKPHLATLNMRNELYGFCRHKWSLLIDPPVKKKVGTNP